MCNILTYNLIIRLTLKKCGGDNLKKILSFILVTFLFVFLLLCVNVQYRRPYPQGEVKPSDVYAAMEKLKGMNEDDLKTYVVRRFQEENIKPYFSGDKYAQNFQAFAPIMLEKPSLYYISNNEKKDLIYEKDFKVLLGGAGKSGTGEGKINSGEDLSADVVKGKVLLNNGIVTKDYIEYAQKNGAKAVITLNRDGSLYDNKDSNLKSYDGLPIFYVSDDIFEDIKNASIVGFNINFKYEKINCYNNAGYIKGVNDESIIYACNSVSGLAYMLELMDNIKASQVKPYNNIVFVLLDKSAGETPSAQAFVDSIKNKEVDKFIMLGPIGIAGTKEVQLSIDKVKGFEMLSLICSYEDPNITVGKSIKNIPASFETIRKSGIEAIYLRDGYTQSLGLSNYNSAKDVIKLTSKEILSRDLSILSKINRRYVFNKEYDNTSLSIGLIIICIIFIPYYLLKLMELKGDIRIKDLQNIIKIVYKYLFLSGVIFFFVAFIGFVPKDILINKISGRFYSNYSFGYVFNQVLQYVYVLFHKGFGEFNTAKVITVIKSPFIRSSKLILLSIFISLIVGVYFGIKNGIKGKDSSGSLAPIVLISIPDALILTLILTLIGLFEKYKVFQGIFGNMTVKTFVMPLVCITIIPTVYIWRMSYTTCVEEVKKDYIRNAKAKGKRGFTLGFNELLPGVLLSVLKSMSGVIIILLSNLILVEYVYYYPGIAFNLLSAYQHGETSIFIPLSLSLCLIYIILTSFFKLCERAIDPFKVKGVK